MAAPIDFYFDFSSPYGYLASCRIDEVAARHDRKVNWRPFLLGVAFKLTGSGPLTSQGPKGDYALHDFARTARLLGVPFAMPEGFPFASVAAARAFYWLLDQDEPPPMHWPKPYSRPLLCKVLILASPQP